jgi:hypothetical protein
MGARRKQASIKLAAILFPPPSLFLWDSDLHSVLCMRKPKKAPLQLLSSLNHRWLRRGSPHEYIWNCWLLLLGEDKTGNPATWRPRDGNSPVQREPGPLLLAGGRCKDGNHSVKRGCFTEMAASISSQGRWWLIGIGVPNSATLLGLVSVNGEE